MAQFTPTAQRGGMTLQQKLDEAARILAANDVTLFNTRGGGGERLTPKVRSLLHRDVLPYLHHKDFHAALRKAGYEAVPDALNEDGTTKSTSGEFVKSSYMREWEKNPLYTAGRGPRKRGRTYTLQDAQGNKYKLDSRTGMVYSGDPEGTTHGERIKTNPIGQWSPELVEQHGLTIPEKDNSWKGVPGIITAGKWAVLGISAGSFMAHAAAIGMFGTAIQAKAQALLGSGVPASQVTSTTLAQGATGGAGAVKSTVAGHLGIGAGNAAQAAAVNQAAAAVGFSVKQVGATTYLVGPGGKLFGSMASQALNNAVASGNQAAIEAALKKVAAEAATLATSKIMIDGVPTVVAHAVGSPPAGVIPGSTVGPKVPPVDPTKQPVDPTKPASWLDSLPAGVKSVFESLGITSLAGLMGFLGKAGIAASAIAGLKEVLDYEFDHGTGEDVQKLADAQLAAGELQYDAAQRSIEAWDEYQELAGETTRPWREAGSWAIDQIRTGLERGTFREMEGDVPEFGGFSREDLEQDEGYLFRREQGEKAIARNANLMGGTRSGAFAARITDFNQGLASTEYQAGFDRALASYGAERAAYHDRVARTERYFNRLTGVADRGQSAVAQYLGAAGTATQGRTQADIYGAEARAQAGIGYQNVLVQERRYRAQLEAMVRSGKYQMWGSLVGSAVGLGFNS